MERYKAKVTTAEYLVSKDLLVFTMHNVETGKEQTYAWSPADYLERVGLSPTAKYTQAQLDKHCLDMIGKELTFAIEGEAPTVASKTDKSRETEINEACAKMAAEAGDKLANELMVQDEIKKRQFNPLSDE